MTPSPLPWSTDTPPLKTLQSPVDHADLYWDTRGPSDGAAVLLLEGFTGQLIGWRDEVCELLVNQGLRISRMDNRDVGLSRHEADGTLYTLAYMANDVIDVLNHAGVQRATLVGQSMGGMSCQHLALNHLQRVAGLVFFYTTPTLEIIEGDALQSQLVAAHTREQAVANFCSTTVRLPRPFIRTTKHDNENSPNGCGNGTRTNPD